MSNRENNQQTRELFEKLCFDLNMDKETSIDGWNSYENLRQHYLFQGDQLHWLAVSLYISCRRNDSTRKTENNPISIDRLLKSANNLSLIEFFDKLHKWEDMSNLTDDIRTKLDQLENAFHLSSCIFDKYPKMFSDLFGGNENKYLSNDYQCQRKFGQINPKYNQRTKTKKCSTEDIFSLGWTLFALSKTIYPSISNDLLSSFHLLISTFQYLYELVIEMKLDLLIQGRFRDQLTMNLSIDQFKLMEILCQTYGGIHQLASSIYQEHFHNDLFKTYLNDIEINEENSMKFIREVNRAYDEIVLRNCIIDERIFLDRNFKFNDFLSSFNENRNQKTFDNRTPLTANQHLFRNDFEQIHSNSSQGLTPISQVNLLVQQLDSIIGNNIDTITSKSIQNFFEEQIFIDDLIERVHSWKTIYKDNYELIEINIEGKSSNRSSNNDQIKKLQSNSSERYFQKALTLFNRALEKILSIERKRLISSNQQSQTIQQAFQKLVLNNEFLKSLLGLSLLLVFYAHGDNSHDFQWIFKIYDLRGYSFLKIIQIFLKTLKEFHQSRSFIKYLSKIEETILSSMVWTKDSSFWIDLQRKGFIQYEQVQSSTLIENKSTPINLTRLYVQSPSKSVQNVSRKLFEKAQQNCLVTEKVSKEDSSFIRSHSDPVQFETNNSIKSSPYSMFFRKLYDLVRGRIDLLSIRIFTNQSERHKVVIWNLFLFLFENYLELLFKSRDLDQIILSTIYFSVNSPWKINQIAIDENCSISWSRLIQAYKTMPNSRLKIVRSVFICDENDRNRVLFEMENSSLLTNNNPSLTPSKPAGTIHRINKQLIGDINSFYQFVFIRLDNLKDNLTNYFRSKQLRDFPQGNKYCRTTSNDCLTVNLTKNLSLNYSSSKFDQDQHEKSKDQRLLKTNFEQTSVNNQSSNVLSSTVQAGQHNTVQTTRTRTRDGKFLTTISIHQHGKSSFNNENISDSSGINDEQTSTNYYFGETNEDCLSSKRTFSKSSSLESFKNKVLIIENDRTNAEQKLN